MSVQYEVTPLSTVKATYNVFIPRGLDKINGIPYDYGDSGTMTFHLTDEGLIVDLFDNDGNCIGTFAATADEFLPFILEV